MASLPSELRQAFRSLVRGGTSTAAAFLTLALGLGLTTALFAVVDGVLLRPLPYPESEQLLLVSEHRPGATGGIGGILGAATRGGLARRQDHRGPGLLQPPRLHLVDARRRRPPRRRSAQSGGVRHPAHAALSRPFLSRERGAGGARRCRRPQLRPVDVAVRRARRRHRHPDAPRQPRLRGRRRGASRLRLPHRRGAAVDAGLPARAEPRQAAGAGLPRHRPAEARGHHRAGHG